MVPKELSTPTFADDEISITDVEDRADGNAVRNNLDVSALEIDTTTQFKTPQNPFRFLAINVDGNLPDSKEQIAVLAALLRKREVGVCLT